MNNTSPYVGGRDALQGASKDPMMSLNDRICMLASQAEKLSATVFETGIRLGVLQPVPTNAGPVAPREAMHICVPLIELEAALNRIGEDLHRIRAFVG